MNSDDWIINNICKKHLPWFCKANVHPNSITFLAVVLSAALPFLHIYGLHWFVVIALILRQLCDCLDGAVARECDKTSKLGGFLDSFADGIAVAALIFIFTDIFMTMSSNSQGAKKNKTNTKKGKKTVKQRYTIACIYTAVIFASLLLILAINYGPTALTDHSVMKQDEGNILHHIIKFFANNSFVLVLVVASVYIMLVKMT